MRSINYEKMLCDIKGKAKNNNEHQATIRPSEYGFGRMYEDTECCIAWLRSNPNILKVEKMGKDFLSVILK